MLTVCQCDRSIILSLPYPPTSDMAGKEKALVQELGEKLFGRLTAADIDVSWETSEAQGGRDSQVLKCYRNKWNCKLYLVGKVQRQII